MTDEEQISRDRQIEAAYNHTIGEVGLEHIKPSFGLAFEPLQRAHDAIHEYLLLASLAFPSQVTDDASWRRKSAFLLFHWEIHDHAHRSLLEALCGYYNVAFALLRVTCELSVRGAFWECLSHTTYRKTAQALRSGGGAKLLRWIEDRFHQDPSIESGLETISASIYDQLPLIPRERKFQPSFRTLVRQLEQWSIFKPIPGAEAYLYDGIYSRLSSDVHIVPERTDIGRRLLADQQPEIFEQVLLPDVLREYIELLHNVMDIAGVIELNILSDLFQMHEKARSDLKDRLAILESLALPYAHQRAAQLSQ